MKLDSIKNITINPEIIHLISSDLAQKFRIIPLSQIENSLIIATDSSPNKEEVSIILGKPVQFHIITTENFNSLFNRYYQSTKNQSVTRLVYDDHFLSNLIKTARDFNSSDIHLEPFENNSRVRIRVDGKLKEVYYIKKSDYPVLVNKIKIQSHLDISEKRLPQDGRLKVKTQAYEFDIRVSILPTLYGEKIVLRLLNQETTNLDLSKLGFSKQQLKTYTDNIRKPNGIILISGPTGSGKTTTLYATLKNLNTIYQNIITIEDPIEYTLEGINQVQLKESIGLSFTHALRTFLRQDPDVIMVGEIRDVETANMAIRASLTGHLVFSTIHTNSALSTISRLIDMDIPSFLIADTLHMSIAQRLIRKLCPHCKEKEKFDPTMLPKQFKTDLKISSHFLAKGCNMCHYTGYNGRKAIYEIIPINESIIDEIRNNTIGTRYQFYKRHQISSLSDQAFHVFAEGETSLDEIYTLLLT